MSIQQQHTGGRPDRSGEILPTGAALLPVLQILALVCLAIFGLRLLEASALTGVGVAVLCCVLAVVGVVGALWVVRRRLGAGRGRAACSVVVLLLVAGPAQLGTIGFSVPVLVVAAALLVVDIGARASLVGDVFVSALPVLSLALGRSWAQTLSDVLSFMALMSVGTALGVVLSGYNVTLAAQILRLKNR